VKVFEIQNPPTVDALIERFGARRLPFVLDSSQSNDGLGEWSFFGAEPFAVLSGKDGVYFEHRASNVESRTSNENPSDGLAVMREWMRPYLCGMGQGGETVPFIGGAVGFLSYDYGREIERMPVLAEDDRDIPDLYFGLYDGIAALNVETGVLYLVALGIRAPEDTVIEELKSIVNGEVLHTDILAVELAGGWQWNMTELEFCSKVERIRDYIAQGDCYQVNLSRRARCAFEGDPIRLYQALRRGNPAPYGAYLELDDLKIISTSPEQFLRKRGRMIETRPIKGTCPRGADSEESERNATALRLSEKDRAELLMIVDLERNDLGRVAEYGSVHVKGLYHQEHYARVIHQTAQVQAMLAEGYDVFDCIRALFPGGSITGAPKIRAMEIIEELEPTRRGVYTGSMGYIGFDGNAELNIAIRSLHLKNGILDYQVGGGIVWDSVPGSEYQETLDKGRAIRETIDALCGRGRG